MTDKSQNLGTGNIVSWRLLAHCMRRWDPRGGLTISLLTDHDLPEHPVRWGHENRDVQVLDLSAGFGDFENVS